ncbi:BtrH N-terminal domain-containing protein [Actinomycetospora soli]|uniref:BtrH N-terminal domain-containing protein n=1 Tax=Actinomycetospora soli TaxID=2893887 RepID=UPI001E52D52F|nr:BtrH N-terminal domain-containing protein [Actinomycetospora soli]MCD2191552.1 BtrH N-terminal domain-containing protein [Actinomycetospora soli]
MTTTDAHSWIGVEGYPHRMAGHCGSGALRDLLEWAGLSWSGEPLSEGTVFGLGGSLSFSYLRGPGLGSPFYLVGRGSGLTESLTARLGIAGAAQDTDDPDEGRAWLHRELDAGRPLLCWADMSELPYLRVRMQMSRHDIVVTGYEPDGHQVRVIDNDRAEPQIIPAAALAAARSSTGFPTPTRHTCYPMRFPDSLPDQRVAAASACAHAAQSMTTPADDDTVTTPGAHAAGHGLDGVATFLADLEAWPDVLARTAETSEQDLHTALITLAVFIEKAGTGGGLFRRLQAQFLAELTDLDERARPAATIYDELAGTWSALAARAGDKTASATTRWRDVRDRARRLPELETDGAHHLRDLARALTA